jgi:2'-5' RNA ligase
MRAFLAVDLDDVARHEARLAAGELLAGASGWRLTPAENLHLTVAFLGEIDESQYFSLTKELSQELLEIEPFTLALAGVGRFPEMDVAPGSLSASRSRPRVLWAGVREGAVVLAQLASACVKACSKAAIEVDRRPFHPHITLARAARFGRCRELDTAIRALGDRAFGTPFQVADVGLYESTLAPGGSRYRRRQRIRLGARSTT